MWTMLVKTNGTFAPANKWKKKKNRHAHPKNAHTANFTKVPSQWINIFAAHQQHLPERKSALWCRLCGICPRKRVPSETGMGTCIFLPDLVPRNKSIQKKNKLETHIKTKRIRYFLWFYCRYVWVGWFCIINKWVGTHF